MISNQETFNLSPYMAIYDIVVPKDNMLRPINDERIITAAIVTTGEQSDGKYLQDLIEKSQGTGMEIDTVLGDTAYSGKDNILYAKKNELELASKLNPQITQGTRTKEDEFEFNKDAGMYVRKAGHMSIRKAYDDS